MLPLKPLLVATLLSLPLLAVANNRPEIGVILTPNSLPQGAAPSAACLSCCIYADKHYSEGAVIKTDGVLLQCTRDSQVLSTNPLVWQRLNSHSVADSQP